jgi:hypothetical protein
MRKFLVYIGFFVASVFLNLGCVTLKQNELYVDSVSVNDTVFYISSEIYKDYVTSEGWVTEDKRCMTAKTSKEAAFEGELGIDLSWNRTKEGCPWLGFGFGWDNWTGKDLSQIKNTAAIQFHVRMVAGERVSLPWAIGLEDFTGSQAWLGMSANAIKAEKITTQWTRVELPLSEFNWEEQGADVNNIKQIIFNTEADGRVFIDEIKIVPYSGGYRNRANLKNLAGDSFIVDGQIIDSLWATEPIAFGANQLHLAVENNYLCVALKVIDANPLENSFDGNDIFQGDALELAFNTDVQANSRRTRYLSTDKHIGIGFSGDQIKAWDWRNEKEFKVLEYKTQLTKDGYIFEAKIEFSELNAEAFLNQTLYGFEVAVDHGDVNGRIRQERWNDPVNNGFYENPSRWGELYLNISEITQE